MSELTDEEKIHRNLAIDLFNYTWTLIDKENRTKEEDAEMIHSAHASRFHWGKIGKPLNLERGEWQISRVYAILNRSTAALYHAQLCLAICKANDIQGFDLAFAYEGMARAHALLGDENEKNSFIELAKEAAEQIEEEDDKEYFLGELATV